MDAGRVADRRADVQLDESPGRGLADGEPVRWLAVGGSDAGEVAELLDGILERGGIDEEHLRRRASQDDLIEQAALGDRLREDGPEGRVPADHVLPGGADPGGVDRLAARRRKLVDCVNVACLGPLALADQDVLLHGRRWEDGLDILHVGHVQSRQPLLVELLQAPVRHIQ